MPAVKQEVVTVKGEITRWRAINDGWGFGVLRGPEGPVAFTGKLLARVGDTVELEGVWNEHERFGLQLKVRACTVARADTTDGIIAWLSSTLPNIGPGRAQALVDRFGVGLWDVIEQRPHELAEVKGITADRLDAIVAAYREHRAERDYMIRLRGWGLTDSQIARCREVDAWRVARFQPVPLSEIVDRVHANPYELSQHVYGFGFVRADQVAKRAGIPHESPARIAAGVEHVLEEAAGAGDCFLWGAEVQRRAAKLLDVAPKLVADGIRSTVASGRIAARSARYYPRRLDEAEDTCAVRLSDMIARTRDANVIDLAARRRQAKG